MSTRITSWMVQLDQRDARELWTLGGLEALRVRHRGNERFQQTLDAIYATAVGVSALGPKPPDSVDIRKPGMDGIWTVTQLARAVGVNARTIRRDIERERISATATTAGYTISADVAEAYISSRRSN